MSNARSDGSDNFIGSLIFAGNYTIPEVTVYFCNKLMRGNRTIKFSSSNLDPFTSPNAREIARMGTEIVGKSNFPSISWYTYLLIHSEGNRLRDLSQCALIIGSYHCFVSIHYGRYNRTKLRKRNTHAPITRICVYSNVCLRLSDCTVKYAKKKMIRK